MTEPLDYTGRVALVTGSGAGIGRAIAIRLAGAGARVAVNDLLTDAAMETARLIGAGGGEAVALPGDMTHGTDVEAVVRGCVERFGGLDVAVNNVGMMGGLGPRPLIEIDADYARRIIDLNLMSTLLCSIAESRAMVAAGRGGVIIHVSSGETTRAAPGMTVYALAKAAVNHLTKSMAVELGPAGIRVNAVAPGTTPTEQVRTRLSPEFLDAIAASTPLGRLCEPDDLANLVLLLASDLAAAVTGQLVLADAGAHLSLSRPSYPGEKAGAPAGAGSAARAAGAAAPATTAGATSPVGAAPDT